MGCASRRINARYRVAHGGKLPDDPGMAGFAAGSSCLRVTHERLAFRTSEAEQMPRLCLDPVVLFGLLEADLPVVREPEDPFGGSVTRLVIFDFALVRPQVESSAERRLEMIAEHTVAELLERCERMSALLRFGGVCNHYQVPYRGSFDKCQDISNRLLPSQWVAFAGSIQVDT
jgi:hypothetical protein